jgi:hypothetical protein
VGAGRWYTQHVSPRLRTGPGASTGVTHPPGKGATTDVRVGEVLVSAAKLTHPIIQVRDWQAAFCRGAGPGRGRDAGGGEARVATERYRFKRKR